MPEQPSTPSQSAVRVDAPAGSFNGRVAGSVGVWKGIRYGAPPVDALRWRAPQPAAVPDQPVDAFEFGSGCPQQRNQFLDLGDGVELDEDCLFLNVWSPALDSDAQTATVDVGGRARPVMVWVHGGAYTFGAASQALYDGAALSSFGDVVVVTLNYRLGALGFLELSPFASDGEEFDTNLAMRDVVLALNWVRDNIASFGGDPDNVTLFGESAGAGMTTALMTSPAAAGLFHRAIAQSSPASSMYGMERAKSVVSKVLTQLGVGEDEMGSLRSLPVDVIIEAATAVYSAIPTDTPGLLAFAPVVDGDILPEHPIRVLHEGRAHPIPLIIGTNRDEATLFKFMKSPLMPITEPTIVAMMTQLASENPDTKLPTREQLLSAYEGVRQRAIGLGIATDIGFRMPTVWLVDGHSKIAPTYLYRFDWATPMLRLIGMNAAHATELPYSWGNLPTSRKDFTFRLGGRRTGQAISARMLSWWTSFAANGTPGDDWPTYDEERHSLVIDRTDRVATDLDSTIRAGWGDEALGFD